MHFESYQRLLKNKRNIEVIQLYEDAAIFFLSAYLGSAPLFPDIISFGNSQHQEEPIVSDYEILYKQFQNKYNKKGLHGVFDEFISKDIKLK